MPAIVMPAGASDARHRHFPRFDVPLEQTAMNLLRRLGDFLVWIGVMENAHFITTDQPDPNLRCPNNDCRQSFRVWTDSAWVDAQFVTRYWRGCPRYRDATDGQELEKHYAKWRTRSWGTRTYRAPR